MDVLGTLNFILSVVIGLVILVALVAMHEFGHGVVARRNGIRVKEFGIGFPPRAKAWNVKQSVLGKNVQYSLNWLPLGGFVQLQGEHDSATKKGDYGAASFWVKTKVLLAGVFVNWMTAAVLLSIVAAMGLPKMIEGQFTVPTDTLTHVEPMKVVTVSPGLPAEKAGLQRGDEIVSLAGVPMDGRVQLSELTKSHIGQTVEVVYKRGGEQKTATVTLRSTNDDKKGYLGLAGGQSVSYRSTWSAPVVGVILTGQLTGYIVQSLGTMVSNLVTGLFDKVNPNSTVRQAGDAKLAEANNNVGGILLVVGRLFPAAREDGIGSLLLVTALISLTLAVMNILPIPALDGGRWFVTLIYRKILRRPLTKETEEKINGRSFVFLLALMALITVLDILKLRN